MLIVIILTKNLLAIGVFIDLVGPLLKRLVFFFVNFILNSLLLECNWPKRVFIYIVDQNVGFPMYSLKKNLIFCLINS
jgi:hypothetical protein